jgi:hypothetical protein
VRLCASCQVHQRLALRAHRQRTGQAREPRTPQLFQNARFEPGEQALVELHMAKPRGRTQLSRVQDVHR